MNTWTYIVLIKRDPKC